MTTWAYGGVNLSTYGVVTMLDDDFDIPDRRGDNQMIPFNHGTVFNEKYYDQRKLAFGISMKASTNLAMETLIDSLKSNLSSRLQKTLAQTREDSTVRNILATVDSPIQIKREGGKFAKAVIEFTCPFPFFRLSTDIIDNTTTINTTPKAMTVTNPGNVEEVQPKIILTGPLSNTVITNSTNGLVLTYTGTITSPRIVTLQVINGQWVATDDLATNKINLFSHSGAAEYMRFEPGSNTLSIADGTHTTGTVKITFKAPYL